MIEAFAEEGWRSHLNGVRYSGFSKFLHFNGQASILPGAKRVRQIWLRLRVKPLHQNDAAKAVREEKIG